MNTHDFPQPKSVIYLARTFFLFGLLLLLLAGAPAAAHASAPEDGFNPGADNDVRAIAIQPDGKILVGGAFTTIGGESHERIARLNADGSMDSTFNASVGPDSLIPDRVWGVALQSDGKILVGGEYQHLNGQWREGIGRLNPDGSLDTSFYVDVDNGESVSIINAILVQSDDKILLGGNFVSMGGVSAPRIVRLNSDGSHDYSFDPGSGPDFPPWQTYEIYALAVQPTDGKIFVGGNFDAFNGYSREHIARLNTDGSVDTSFAVGADDQVVVIAVQPDGKILLGGAFSLLAGVSVPYLARINPDGLLDTTFDPNVNGDVRTIALQADGKIIIGGKFTSVGGQTRKHIARLDADGTLDASFNPDANDDVWAVALQTDGQVLMGGDFTTLGGYTHNRIARVSNDTAATQTLGLNADGGLITWLRGGSSPEVFRVTFEVSYDGTNYTMLGDAAHIAGGWQLPVNLTRTRNINLRARGYYATGEFGSSGSIVQTVQHIYDRYTKVVITSSENPALQNDWVEIIATVVADDTSAGTPTGTIQLWNRNPAIADTPQPIAGCEGNLPMYGWGQVFCWTPNLPPVLNLITATYSGDTNYDPGETDSEFAQTVYPSTAACHAKPGEPTLLSPANRAREAELRVMLDWTAMPCAKSYEVVVHRDSRKGKLVEKKIVSNVSALKTKQLEAGHSYFWRVRACEFSDAPVCGKWSDWREFRVKPNATGGNKP